jgi:hypothetical protein
MLKNVISEETLQINSGYRIQVKLVGIISRTKYMKPSGISGIKRGNIRKTINELAMNSKNIAIRNLHRGIHSFKSGYHPRSNLLRMKLVIGLQSPTLF